MWDGHDARYTAASMAADPLVQLARNLTRQRFTAALRGRYLVFDVRAEPDEDIDFYTQVAAGIDDNDRDTGTFDAIDLATLGSEPRVLELAKAPGNPFTDRISLGRSPSCDLVLSDASVSKLHAHFRDQDGALRVSDVGSQNGTWLNDVRLEPHIQTPLQLGDVLQFGGTRAVLMDSGMLWDAVHALSP